jgi:hypothetical protein
MEAAGLICSRFYKGTEEELIQVVRELWIATHRDHNRRPCKLDVKAYGCPVSVDTIAKHFGSWRKALIAVAKAANVPQTDRPAKPVELPKQRKPLSARKRYFIIKRDRYMCRICKAAGVELEIDHIVPVSRGGSDTLDNLQTLCVPCNRSKAAQLQ